MKRCPVCNTRTKVTRNETIDNAVRRRRACPKCGRRFSTVELLIVPVMGETPFIQSPPFNRGGPALGKLPARTKEKAR